jgi:hypothetical protein
MPEATERSLVLLLYHRPVTLRRRPDASTILEHVGAFRRHSSFQVCEVNTALGMPNRLCSMHFDAIVLHYTLFSTHGYHLDRGLVRYLDATGRDSYKVALFQDEYHYCQQRFAFLNRHHIDCVYTMLEPEFIPAVYGRYTGVPRVVPSLAGYVGDELLRVATDFAMPDAARTIDVGYRGRRLPLYFGRSGQEKYEIGMRFNEAARNSGLRLDIACEEGDRIYGADWYRFLANCKAVLGTESGVGLFDLEDEVLHEYTRLTESGVPVTVELLERGALGRIDGKITNRVIAPRHFEAAALRICQILYEGRYSGMLTPMVHYIPLKKDFSNVDEVIERFRDPEIRATLAENAYRDLIASGEYTYEAFISGFDQTLIDAGLRPGATVRQRHDADLHLRRGIRRRRYRVLGREVMRELRGLDFPGKPAVRPLARAVMSAHHELRSRRASS